MVKSPRQNQYLSIASKILMNLLLFSISFSLSFHIRRLVDLIPQNKHGIENQSDIFSESGYLSLIGMMVFTVVFYLLLKYLEKEKRRLFRLFIISIATLSVFFSVIAPSVASIENNVDTFHHGEQLSPAKAFEQGKEPYKDIFFLRGAGEDVIAPWLSFQLFGHSMGAHYFFEGFLRILACVLFFWLLYVLFKKNLTFLIVSLWFISSSYDRFWHSRDIFTWLGLLIVVKLIQGHGLNPKLLLGLGALTSSSIFYAFDRGIYLHVLMGIVALLVLLFVKKDDKYLLNTEGWMTRLKKLSPLVVGYCSATLIIGFLLGFSGLLAFLKTTLDASRYQGIMFNHSFPQFSEDSLIAWLPVFVLMGLAVVIFNTIRQERRHLSRETVLEVIFLVFSLVFLRSATGRPDAEHIAYGTVVLFVLFFLVTFRRLRSIINAPSRHGMLISIEKSWPVLILMFLIFSPSIVDYYAFAESHQRPLAETRIFLTSQSKPDEFWMTKKVKNVTEYIKSNTQEGEYLFVMSSDPIFYYSTGLKNPSRFYISWFADPKPFEEEMLRDLKSNPPKIVIYETGLWDSPDNISMKDRLPAVNEWVKNNYTKQVKIEDTTILLKD